MTGRYAGYTFDGRRTHVRLGFFYRKTDTQTSPVDDTSSSNGGRIYRGHVSPDGVLGSVFKD